MPTNRTNVQADYPDNRDWIFRPPLIKLEPECIPPEDLVILDQKNEGACTGFAMAAAINLLNRNTPSNHLVSERMLYEMAKRHDEWAGEDYGGSSLRGAIHGFKNMGVCPRDLWPYKTNSGQQGDLTIERAKAARNLTLGAYYRLRPEITDFQTALMQTGVVVASARYHPGWSRPVKGKIQKRKSTQGGHAFAIVGYDKDGFIIQNSWGAGWGERGQAIWTYEDWIENVMDGWVFQLALPTPQIFELMPLSSRLITYTKQGLEDTTTAPRTRRDAIAGHFVHIDDGEYATRHNYWSTAADVKQTANFFSNSTDYQHLLIYGHGGLNSPKASAARIAAMKPVFKANGIYPFHVMYDTGLVEELKDLILGKTKKAETLVGGVTDWLDRMVEHIVRRPGTLIWEEMKADAHDAFDGNGAGTETLKFFIKAMEGATGPKKKIHLVGHSTGAVLFAKLLAVLRNNQITIDSCSLMAPACTIDLYHETYLKVLKKEYKLRIKNMEIYNLRDELEQDDSVGSKLVYRKSLLYLVSNAFERIKERPLLGMENFKNNMKKTGKQPQVYYSNGVSGNKTRSTSHGGFDNDLSTMNNILKTILGKKPKRPFEKEDLNF